ncbi:XRE family transcriptional regulator [Moraxella sp. ZJ142]|uniref:XRE family transcriptional regulator n=1 Tax=Moraxella marmotae TaxID=3344520 RepID=UPI0035D42C2A
METLADRLKFARKNAKISQAAVAKAVGISQPSYQALESGKSGKSAFLPQIANALKVNINWLATGQGEIKSPQQVVDELIESMPNGITHDQIEPWRQQTWVEVYDLKFCCGDGSGYAEFEPLKKTLPFDDSFFRFRGVKPEFFKIIYAKGDSMAPYINEGDAVGLDISDKIPKDGEAYALFLDGDTMIKRIFREAGGVLILSSDNKAYKDKIVDDHNGDSLIIIGRVAYRSG